MSNKLTVSISTLGCKLNQAESEALSRAFDGAGYVIASGEQADIVILNTCSVTQTADRKARHQLRWLRKLNPQALIVATGCYAEWAGPSLREYGADMVICNLEKASLPQMLEDCECTVGNNAVGTCERPIRWRSFVKIQDGCRNFCSYCIVPLLRRDVYSRDVDSVVNEIKARVNEGYKEVVLTGTEIGSYHYAGTGLEGLISSVLSETSVERLHLSSLQPQHITQGLLCLWDDDRLVRHFHLALQSGSDSVLKRMKRRYETCRFEGAIKMIREMVPDASVTTDIIIGFPGETDEEFRQSYTFCQSMKFAAMHVFAYSARSGTLAARMQGKVCESIKRERSLLMLTLAARSADEFAGCFLGQRRPVLWENRVKPGMDIYLGFTNNYIRVYTSSMHDIANSISTAIMLAPVGKAGIPVVRSSAKGNHGELWGELNENQCESHAALIA